MTIKYTERFNTLWNIYDNTLAHNKKGSKFKALQAFEKYKEDEQDRIIFDTKALMRHFKQSFQPDRLPHLTTWLNGRYFDQPIPSQMETKHVEKLKECEMDKCRAPVHSASFLVCSRHIPSEMDNQLREAWKKTGLDRKSPTLGADCRAYIKSKGYKI